MSMFYTDEDRAAGLVTRELETARETGRFEVEGWRVRKGSGRYWASVVLTPIRERASALQAEPHRVKRILSAGAAKARALAQGTMALVRRQMGVFDRAED